MPFLWVTCGSLLIMGEWVTLPSIIEGSAYTCLTFRWRVPELHGVALGPSTPGDMLHVHPPTTLVYRVGAIDGQARLCVKTTQSEHLVDSGTDWPVCSLFQLDTAFLWKNTHVLAHGCDMFGIRLRHVRDGPLLHTLLHVWNMFETCLYSHVNPHREAALNSHS